MQTLYLSQTIYDDIIVKNLEKFSKCSELISAKPEVFSSMGKNEVVAFSGGYARVYKIISNNRQYALRLWLRNPGKVQQRSHHINSFFSNHSLPYFVKFKYLENAFSYQGKTFPATLMDWVDGPTLSKFLDENINNGLKVNKIEQASKAFLEMVKSLHSLQVAHGDLQSENMKVLSANGTTSLVLIDYDSLYVPGISTSSLDALPGVSTFQHPRRPKIMKEKADYFSELIIYLSLLVYSEHPDYWTGSNDNDKKLLFDESDLSNPLSSKRFAELKKTSSQIIKNLTDQLAYYCQNDPSNLKPLEQVIADANKPLPFNIDVYFDKNGIEKNNQPKESGEERLNAFFDNKKEPLAFSQKCPRGHVSTNPKDIYCPNCNSLSSFFGPSKNCPNPKCRKNIPSRHEVKYCPHCSTNL